MPELNAFQKEVQKLAKSMGLKGDAERQVYNTPQYQQLLQRFFGNIGLPAGVDESQVISRDAGSVTYKDAEGFTHRLERNLDGTSPDVGKVTEASTDRPAVLPVTKQIPGVEGAIQQALGVLSGTFGQKSGSGTQQGNTQQQQEEGFFGLPDPNAQGGTPGFQGTGALGNLSPADNALFDAILKSTIEQLQQQFTSQGGRLVAELYGRGMNESTLANDAITRLNQGQGLVLNAALADDARSRFDMRKFLTDLSTKSSLDLFNAIMGNETTRSVSSGQLGLGRDELALNTTTANRNFQLANRQLDLQEQAQSPWRSILSAVASLGAAAIPGLGMFNKAPLPTSSLPRVSFQ